MIAVDKMNDFVETLHKKSRRIKTHLIYRAPETRMLVFFSLGALADMYLVMTEEYMKQKKENEANYFSSKAEFVRVFCTDVFEEVPEKDFYTDTYKIPQNLEIVMPAEELQQMAMFCAQNLQLNEAVMSDPKALGGEIKNKFRTLKKGGIYGEYLNALSKTYKDVKDKPPKVSNVYELLLLLENAQQLISMLKTEEKVEKGEKEIEGLEGFKVKP